MRLKRVVITGMGVVSPFSPDANIKEFWENLVSGSNSIGRIEAFDTSLFPTHIGAQISIKNSPAFDKTQIISLRAAKQALKDATLDPHVMRENKAGLIVGTTLGGILSGQKIWENNKLHPPKKLLRNYPLSASELFLTGALGIKGPSFTISNSCSSGIDALGVAYNLIQNGQADILIAGGVDVLSEFSFSGFGALRCLAKDKVRPFDAKRQGLALGDGAAFLVAENLESAVARKTRICAEILGYGSFNEAYHLTRPNAQGRGLAKSISSALKDAGINATGIDYINAHGTGTFYNDPAETKAIKSALGKYASRIPISSTKSMLGHALGASGAIEAIICILAIRTGIIPPTINYETKDRLCNLNHVANRAQRKKVRTALSVSAGFAGQTCAIILGKFNS